MAPIPLANVYACIGIVRSGSDSTIKWRLTQDIFSSTTPTAGDTVFSDLSDFWAAMVWDADVLEEIRVYNWVLGTQPYPNGLPIFVIPYNISGSASGDWTTAAPPQPYCGNDVVLRIDKFHNGIGKPGRSFMRNLLRDNDIVGDGGVQWSLNPLSVFKQSQLNTIVTATGWGTHFASGSSAVKGVVVQASRKHDTVSGYGVITSLNLIGASTNKPTRKSKK